MYFGAEYRKIADIDISALREAVETLPESLWFQQTGRQEVYKVHARTQSIPLIFDADMRHTGSTVHALFDRFEPLLNSAINAISSYYITNRPAGVAPDVEPYFARIILVRLPAGASIGSHRDYGASLSRAHRIHLPIVSCPETVFGIAGIIKHLAPGELWEINNRKPHAVRNDSAVARIHMIFDYVLPGELVSDPDGDLVA